VTLPIDNRLRRPTIWSLLLLLGLILVLCHSVTSVTLVPIVVYPQQPEFFKVAKWQCHEEEVVHFCRFNFPRRPTFLSFLFPLVPREDPRTSALHMSIFNDIVKDLTRGEASIQDRRRLIALFDQQMNQGGSIVSPGGGSTKESSQDQTPESDPYDVLEDYAAAGSGGEELGEEDDPWNILEGYLDTGDLLDDYMDEDEDEDENYSSSRSLPLGFSPQVPAAPPSTPVPGVRKTLCVLALFFELTIFSHLFQSQINIPIGAGKGFPAFWFFVPLYLQGGNGS